MVAWSLGRLVAWSLGRWLVLLKMNDWLIGWVARSFDCCIFFFWLVDWLVDWLVNWLVGLWV